jgi:Fic family protein
VFTPRHEPENTLYKQLIFALKYEGINLIVLKKLFLSIEKEFIIEIIRSEKLGRYSRRLWFIYEWLLEERLDLPDLQSGNYVSLVNEKIQYAIQGEKSFRHRIINNLPGTRYFCPLIFRTEKLEAHINANLSQQKNIFLNSVHKDVLQRASSFLLLKDSKASFTIEGEQPSNNRAMRWGKAIGQAGDKPLTIIELERLQQIIIENPRFLKMGLRAEGGFVGEHDRNTGEPLPEHVSARPKDLEQLLNGLIATNNLLQDPTYDAVLAAASIAFGFVFIHPFVDGNGRLHRYIIHHILAVKQFTQQGIIFPVSASVLNHIIDYKKVLESYSHPVLSYIDWKTTSTHNVEVTNETIDFYRYYDATSQAEFLYDCVDDTLQNIIPKEINYLRKYDEFKRYIDNNYEMPDKMLALLVRFLEQNNGVLSKRALLSEFSALKEKEAVDIEACYKKIFS